MFISDVMIEVEEAVFFDRMKLHSLSVVPSLECQDVMNNYYDDKSQLVGQHEMIGCGDIYTLSESLVS